MTQAHRLLVRMRILPKIHLIVGSKLAPGLVPVKGLRAKACS
jgi:hypothetical protein